MSKRKGLSAEDKRRVILSIYHEKKEPFNLKEIETLASKMGVVQQTVKDMNQSLVDDFLVYSDKIGSANFFWSFPSKAFQDRKTAVENMTAALDRSKSSAEEVKSLIRDQTTSRQDADRPAKIARLEELRRREAEIDSILEASKANDPQELNRLKKCVEANLDSANRWTDNIWAVKKYLTKKKGMQGKEADRLLKIDSNFDSLTMDDIMKSGGKGGNKSR